MSEYVRSGQKRADEAEAERVNKSVGDKSYDSSAVGLAAKAKPSTPAAAEEDPSKMSPLQRAAYMAKKRREGASTPTAVPTPLDDQEKKKNKAKNQLAALTGE
jgi:hypothetical protein